MLLHVRRSADQLLKHLRRADVRGLAHVTGGGIPGNLVRILPRGLVARVERGLAGYTL